MITITEVRIFLAGPACNDRIRAYASIVLDDAFCVRDIKILEGPHGLFLSMPARKRCDHCPACGAKTQLLAAWCQKCGGRLAINRVTQDENGRMDLYDDICHPVNHDTRKYVEDCVLVAYEAECARQEALVQVDQAGSPKATGKPDGGTPVGDEEARPAAGIVAGIAARFTNRRQA